MLELENKEIDVNRTVFLNDLQQNQPDKKSQKYLPDFLLLSVPHSAYKL